MKFFQKLNFLLLLNLTGPTERQTRWMSIPPRKIFDPAMPKRRPGKTFQRRNIPQERSYAYWPGVRAIGACWGRISRSCLLLRRMVSEFTGFFFFCSELRKNFLLACVFQPISYYNEKLEIDRALL